jgi:hypothetical protein
MTLVHCSDGTPARRAEITLDCPPRADRSANWDHMVPAQSVLFGRGDRKLSSASRWPYAFTVVLSHEPDVS